MEESKLTYIFCYGSNHPEQISKRLGIPLSDVLDNCRACTLKNYFRAHMGVSKNWEGGSAATITPSTKNDMNAFAYLMTSEQVTQMDKFEHVPKNYEREDVELVDKEGEIFQGQAYIMRSKDKFCYP
mmetsp:Transcript_4307/g.3613  ORF Transcript_4307/g.3613 Transcript_4307/m.3613 type:complete len:127 (+) Transcript_4307:24-404(+)